MGWDSSHGGQFHPQRSPAPIQFIESLFFSMFSWVPNRWRQHPGDNLSVSQASIRQSRSGLRTKACKWKFRAGVSHWLPHFPVWTRRQPSLFFAFPRPTRAAHCSSSSIVPDDAVVFASPLFQTGEFDGLFHRPTSPALLPLCSLRNAMSATDEVILVGVPPPRPTISTLGGGVFRLKADRHSPRDRRGSSVALTLAPTWTSPSHLTCCVLVFK